MAITKMGMLVAVVGLLAMVQHSVQMRSSSMLEETGNDLSSWAIIVSRDRSENVLLESGDFEQHSTQIIGERVFRTGLLMGRPVVLVNTGKYSANVASALQMALCMYRIRGVLYFGNAGDLTEHKDIGSVVIPSKVSFSGIWQWLDVRHDEEAELVFGNFNEDGNNNNNLVSIKFSNATLYTSKNGVEHPRYLETDKEWMTTAESIEPQLPDITIHVGPKASSADIKVKNAAYASFLSTTFGFKTVDQESATIALVSKSNDKPYIVFLGVSNSARRGDIDPTEKVTATKNAYIVLKTFLKSLPQPRGYITTYV